MTYRELLERLFQLRRFGMSRGLDGMRALLDRLGRPEAKLPVIHIGGTNGKGSTAAFVESALRAAGHRVGLYTSPHLLRFTERIRVGGDEIAQERAVEWGRRVFEACVDNTFFEVATALAFLAFAEEKVDVAVVEVGLGGRLDATNVIEAPLCTVVTGVGLDHTEVLGDTVAEIARQKAGIFKANVPAVMASDDLSARVVLLGKAARVRAPAYLFGRDFDDRDLPPLGLLGAHQQQNAALARQALMLLPPALHVPTQALLDGFGEVRWPGRLEWLNARILVDAAHNGEGARALAKALPALVQARQLTLIVGVVADKDARAIVAPLQPLCRRVIATAPPTPRARAPGSLAKLASCESAPDLEAALAMAAHDEVVLVAGSIFLVGEARRLVLGEAADPVAAQDPPAGNL